MSKMVSIADAHWFFLYAGLSRENKKVLEGYYASIYPRDYLRKLIAALEEDDVQFKEAKFQ